MKRLIFFVGVYDTLDIFTYELKKEFEHMGYETMLFDSRKMEEGLAKLAKFMEEPVKAVITFNNLGFNMELAVGKNIWEELGIPCINILMDHPFCYKKALDEAPFNSVVLCTDRNHMNYVSRFYPNIPISGFLPHAGKEIREYKKPIVERAIDVIYAGNLSKSFAENIIPDLSVYSEFDVKEVCKDAYEDMITHPSKTTEQAIEEQLIRRGFSFSEEKLCQIIADLHFVDLYVVSCYREQVVRVLAESGINITLYGAGWDACEWVQKENVTYGGKIPAEEVVVQMQEAKIVLSTMTWFKDGTHDRVFNGMLQGAVAVSDSSIYMKEVFCGDIAEDNCELFMFELEEIDSLPNMVKRLLEDPKRMQEIANRGYQKAKKEHTWRARAEELERDLLMQLQ